MLGSTVRLERIDQDIVDRLSDLSGQVRPGEVIPAYLTIYPLPSRQHTVVARTWPDLTAPRAGCVLTRSLIVPRTVWETAPSLDGFISLLTPFRASEDLQALMVPPSKGSLATVPTVGMAELVEALFLEARKPIVAFDATNAEVAAVRLLTAFWPSFRGNFSICTYALGPRKLAGRDFDLVFSPKSVKSRFSEWGGRKIDFGSAKAPRHRWSPEVADAIFANAQPSLVRRDELDLLAGDALGDEALFRKSLLWNELAEKADRVPSATLGMLDILNSQPGTAHRVLPHVGQIIARGAANAVAELPVPEAWQFLDTLAGKLHAKTELDALDVVVRRHSAALTRKDPDSAVSFTRSLEEASEALPETLLIGMGEGLRDAGLMGFALGIPPRIGTFLMATVPGFTPMLAKAIRDNRLSPQTVLSFLEAGDASLRRQAASTLLPEIDSAEFAPLIPATLRRSSDSELTEWIMSIITKTKLTVQALDDGIVDAIRDDESMDAIRNGVAEKFTNKDADRFLIRTLKLLPHDVNWLTRAKLPGKRSAILLTAVMASHNDRALMEAQRDEAVRSQLFDVLSRDLANSAQEMARLLLIGAVSTEDLLSHGRLVLPHLPRDQRRKDLLARVVEQGLMGGRSGDVRVGQAVSEYLDEVGARQVVWWATSQTSPGWRVGQNLMILAKLTPSQRKAIEAVVDELAERLTRRSLVDLDGEGFAAWAALLWESRTGVAANYIRASSISMSATIERTQLPVSEVVAAAFPGIYGELIRAKETEPDGLLGALMALPRMFVGDWDHAKPARHGLVDAFMASSWPPSHLLLAAERAGILDRICIRVLRQRGGEHYLRRAIEDLGRLDVNLEKEIIAEVRSLAYKDTEGEWD